MAKIIPQQLIRLRGAARLSQAMLAQRSGVSEQQIYRIETSKTLRVRTTTLERLAEALKVSPDALSQNPADTDAGPAYPFAGSSEMKVRVSDQARNAMALVSRQYGLPATRIIELAPFLFAWAAQASLKARTARLEGLVERYDAVEAMQTDFPHLSAITTHHWAADEILEHERRSIAKGDIFGETIPFDGGNVGNSDADEGEDNPFARFLSGLAAEMEDATFTEFRSAGQPDYSVAFEQAKALLGDNDEAANAVISGLVRLHEMPAHLSGPDQGPERAEWVSGQYKAASDRFWAENPDLKRMIDEAGQDGESLL